MTEINIIEKLAGCIRKGIFSIQVLPDKTSLSEYSLKEIQIVSEDEKLLFTVYDEYNDTDIQNPVLWLNLIVDTCSAFEEAEGYKTWLSDEGYDDTPYFQSLYQEYAKIIPKVRKLIGDDIEAIAYQHFEFNTATAKKLREYKL